MAELPYREFQRAEQAQSNKARRLFEYWASLKRNGRPGPRAAFDPTEVPSLLSSLLLGDIQPRPFRVFFRLVGTKVAAFSRLDFSGRYLNALDYAKNRVQFGGKPIASHQLVQAKFAEMLTQISAAQHGAPRQRDRVTGLLEAVEFTQAATDAVKLARKSGKTACLTLIEICGEAELKNMLGAER